MSHDILEVLHMLADAADDANLPALAEAIQGVSDKILTEDREEADAVTKPAIDLYDNLPIVGQRIVAIGLNKAGPCSVDIELAQGLESTGPVQPPPTLPANTVALVTLSPTGITRIATKVSINEFVASGVDVDLAKKEKRAKPKHKTGGRRRKTKAALAMARWA